MVGNRIDLGAFGLGGIGLLGNDLEINTATSGAGSGRLYAEATLGIFVTETENELSVLAAKSTQGDVRLTIPDTNQVRGPPPGPAPRTEDLLLLVTGTSLVSEGQPRDTTPGAPDTTTTTRTGIWAKLDISLWVGDDVVAPTASDIVAGGTIYIHGDANRLTPAVDAANPDPLGTPSATNADTHTGLASVAGGFGTTMTFAGRLGGLFDLGGASDRTDETIVFGHVDVDRFVFDATLLGAEVHVYGSQNRSALDQTPCTGAGLQTACGDGEDAFLVDELRTPDDPALHTLTLDGQQGTDHYAVQTTTDATARTSSTSSTPAPPPTGSTRRP